MLLAQAEAALALILIVFMLIMFAFWLLMVVSGWKVFSKAGQPGWGVLVPFYNLYLMLKIVGRPGWWLLLMFVPVVGAIVGIVVLHDMSKSFGRDVGTTLGLLFLPMVFWPILGFGSAEYEGPAAAM